MVKTIFQKALRHNGFGLLVHSAKEHAPVVEHQHCSTEDRQHCTGGKSHGACGDAVGKPGGQEAGNRGYDDAQEHHIPLFHHDGRVDEDVADGGDQGREGHDEGAGAHRCFQLHAEKRREDHQHHHPAASTHEARAEADGQPEKEGDGHALPVQSLALCRLAFPACVWLYKEANANEESEKKREAPQHHVPRQVRHVAAHGAHGKDAHQHDPSSSEVDVFVPCVCPGGDGGAQDVRGQGDGRGLVDPRLPGERRTQYDQNRHHHRGRGQARQPCPDTSLF